MTKIDIYSGFLGAGKTTLIKKLIEEGYKGEKLVLIENEFGEIGIDGSFLKEAGVTINEMNSGCICCSLVGDFDKALRQVLDDFEPDRVIIEPSGVGKISDIVAAVQNVQADIALNIVATVVDVNKCKMYMKNFGEFFNNQIEHAGAIVLSHTGKTTVEKLHTCLALIREHNPTAAILTTDWNDLTGEQILAFLEEGHSAMEEELREMEEHLHRHECGCGHHEHHHEEGECCCGHRHGEHHDHECHHHDRDEHDHECHHHDHDECEHEHHHEDGECCCGHHHDHDHHDHECGCSHHEHHHEHEDRACGHHHEHRHGEDECCCGHHHGHDHHHHHADEVFTSLGLETARKYSEDELASMLSALEDEEKYGMILRAKGIVASEGSFIHFDYVPGEPDIRHGAAEPTGRLCIIGSKINEAALKELFKL